MANEEHVALLRQGVEVWNAWRRENPDIRPDLCRADLTAADLGDAHLRGADLDGTVFMNVNLTETKVLDQCKHHGPSGVDQRIVAGTGDTGIHRFALSSTI
jgi:hypothetical protein